MQVGFILCSWWLLAYSWIVKTHASPEISTYILFFTLTLYYFHSVLIILKNKSLYYHLSYIALGLTVLTKGYPYIVNTGGIIGLFVLIDSRFNSKVIFYRKSKMKLLTGSTDSLDHWDDNIYMYISLGMTLGNSTWNFWQSLLEWKYETLLLPKW
jgi:hypothetical protein